MYDTKLIYTEGYFSGFYILYSVTYIFCNGTHLRVGHQATGTQYFTQASDLRHHLWCSHHYIYICPAVLNLLYVFVQANVVSACSFGFLFLIWSTKHQNRLGLTCTIGQRHGTAQGLVGFTGVNAQTNVKIH